MLQTNTPETNVIPVERFDDGIDVTNFTRVEVGTDLIFSKALATSYRASGSGQMIDYLNKLTGLQPNPGRYYKQSAVVMIADAESVELLVAPKVPDGGAFTEFAFHGNKGDYRLVGRRNPGVDGSWYLQPHQTIMFGWVSSRYKVDQAPYRTEGGGPMYETYRALMDAAAPQKVGGGVLRRLGIRKPAR